MEKVEKAWTPVLPAGWVTSALEVSDLTVTSQVLRAYRKEVHRVWRCNELNYVPPNAFIEVLTPNISECDLIWQ